MREGSQVCLLAAGTILDVALKAAEQLDARGISAKVFSFHTIKPLDEGALAEAFGRFKLVATVEEHSVLGGLGGSVAEWKAESNAKTRLLRFGTSDEFLHETCDQNEAREHYGLTPSAIAERIGREL
jgi:transketolase